MSAILILRQTDRHIWVMVGGCNFWTRCSVISIGLERQEVIGIGGKKKKRLPIPCERLFHLSVKGSLSFAHTQSHTYSQYHTHVHTSKTCTYIQTHRLYIIEVWGLGPWQTGGFVQNHSMQAGRAGWSGGGSNHYYAFRRTVALRIFSPCSRAGRHIPLALLSGLFPAAGGFCQPLPHCPSFLCSLAPTMAFFSAS